MLGTQTHCTLLTETLCLFFQFTLLIIRVVRLIGGVIIRVPAASVNIYKRDVQGVIVMRIEEGNQVVSIEAVERTAEEERDGVVEVLTLEREGCVRVVVVLRVVVVREGVAAVRVVVVEVRVVVVVEVRVAVPRVAVVVVPRTLELP